MRNWIGGGFLAVVTTGALAFVLAGKPHPSHVGPCVSGTCSATLSAELRPGSDVVDVVPPADLARATPTDQLPEPRRLPIISFDEPPFAVIPAAATDGPDFIPQAAD